MGNRKSSYPPEPEELIRRMCIKVVNPNQMISTDAWKCREIADLTGLDEDLVRKIYEPRRREYFGGTFLEDDYDMAEIPDYNSRCCPRTCYIS